MKATKRIVFLTGSRADFGKIKSLIEVLGVNEFFDVHIFITGMHTLKQYGNTAYEIERQGYKNLYKYINQNLSDTMDAVLGKTVSGFSDYVKEVEPDMIVVHGDRVEALAGSIVGSFNNILVAHIEGGEVSGTVDELVRHAVTKMSHLHFVANSEAKQRLVQLGERAESVYIIGSPDIDIMLSENLPNIQTVKKYYDIIYKEYSVVLFHPVTTEIDRLPTQVKVFVDSLIESKMNYVVVYPNNDHGTDVILREYKRLEDSENFKIFPSMRFEYFLTLMKNAKLVIGNSSAGIREAPVYAVPSVDIGTRQHRRDLSDSIVHVDFEKKAILSAINNVDGLEFSPTKNFGSGCSDKKFFDVLADEDIWSQSTQKIFVDM